MSQAQDLNQALIQARSLIQSGQRADGDAILTELLRANPTESTIPFYLGMSALVNNDLIPAIDWFTKAIELDDTKPEYYCNLGRVAGQIGRYPEAETFLSQALSLKPDYPEALINIANVYFETEQFDRAEAAIRKSIELQPYPLSLNLLGNIFKESNRYQEAQQAYVQALKLDQSYEVAFTNLLRVNMLVPCDADALAADIKQLGNACTHTIKPFPPAEVDRNPDRKLKIAMLISDFAQENIFHLLRPVLQNYDRSQFEIVCFNDTVKQNPESEEYKRLSQEHIETFTFSDEAIANRIREDKIDIAIDLAGLNIRHRMRSLAQKPAPIQMSWLSAPLGTGLSQIDYRITDATIDPEGNERYYAEKLLRLPGAFFCYAPPDNQLPIAPAPRNKKGFYTFGSFNQVATINDQQLGLFASILKHALESRLLFKAQGADKDHFKKRIKSIFQNLEISSERVMFEGISTGDEYLRAFGEVDVMLDSFPYNSLTSTLHGAFMGVPMLTLCGKTAASRVGMTILNELEMIDLVAQTPKEFVSKGVHLAQNPQITDAVRRVLRQRLLDSSVCDAAGFTNLFTTALRQAWRQYCTQ